HYSTLPLVAFCPDGYCVISGSRDCSIAVWDEHTGMVALILTGHRKAIRTVSFAPGAKRIVSDSLDNTIRLWDLKTGQQVSDISLASTEILVGIAYCADGLHV
ncbi:WD40 repeat-like protein, partial [Exidia glandulosa HHB12029]